MKKVLFATTALVASAGIASAQGVEISGSAEMGVVGGDRHGETQFWQSVDVRFTMSGETDNGLTFGATIDLDDVADMAISTGAGATSASGHDPVDIGAGEQFADFNVFISGDFGTLTMGDTDGAFDWAMQEVNIVGGSIDDSETFHAGFNGNSGLDGLGAHEGQIVRYDHTIGDFAFAVSVEIDEVGAGLDPIFGIGGKWDGDLGGLTLGVGLGYQTGQGAAGVDSEIFGISVDTSFDNGLSAALNYSSRDTGGVTTDHIGVGIGYEMDAIAVGLNYGQYDTGGATSDGFGLAVNYDLGGGATMHFGYGSSSPAGGPDSDSFSLGLSMSF